MLENIINDLNNSGDEYRATACRRFFKTWKWEYWEWDQFIWLTVPQQREIAKKYKDLDYSDLKKLLQSPIHEYRFTALAILVLRYKKADEKLKKEIYDFYMENISAVNNWDLVDCSCSYIIWNYLIDKDKTILYDFAKSENLWIKRIGIISTFQFIRIWLFDDTLRICEILMKDKHDLIHKACGWMLREVWKMNQEVEEQFLRKYYKIMPRTMLRYSIEKFDQNKKDFYMWRVV